jgi:hypothetical protein
MAIVVGSECWCHLVPLNWRIRSQSRSGLERLHLKNNVIINWLSTFTSSLDLLDYYSSNSLTSCGNAVTSEIPGLDSLTSSSSVAAINAFFHCWCHCHQWWCLHINFTRRWCLLWWWSRSPCLWHPTTSQNFSVQRDTLSFDLLCWSKQYNDSYLKSFATGQSLRLN